MRPVKVYRGQASLRRDICDPCSVSEAERIRQDDESVGAPILRCVEGAVQVGGLSHPHHPSLHLKRLSDSLQLTNLGCIDVRVSKDRDARRPGDDLVEDLQMFAAQFGKIEKHPCKLPPGRAMLSTSPASTGSISRSTPVARALEAADMEELPQYFWLHITSAVVPALLALIATAALWSTRSRICGDGSLARALATRPLGRRIRYRRGQQARPRDPITRLA
jgi:hypothetical protein